MLLKTSILYDCKIIGTGPADFAAPNQIANTGSRHGLEKEPSVSGVHTLHGQGPRLCSCHGGGDEKDLCLIP